MADYIEREAAVMKIREWFWSAPGVHPKLDRDTAEELLFSIPAADVVPVRHGRWVPTKNFYGLKCSECGARVKNGARRTHNWCYSCGARMDLEG